MIAEDLKSVNALLAMGAALEARDGAAGETALHLAAVQGSADITYALLNAGADPLCPDASGAWTPLHAAAAGGHLRVVRLLLDHGGTLGPADTRAKDVDGKTAADVAAARHYFEVAEELGDTRSRIARLEACLEQRAAAAAGASERN